MNSSNLRCGFVVAALVSSAPAMALPSAGQATPQASATPALTDVAYRRCWYDYDGRICKTYTDSYYDSDYYDYDVPVIGFSTGPGFGFYGNRGWGGGRYYDSRFGRWHGGRRW